eukprot:g32858.t1
MFGRALPRSGVAALEPPKFVKVPIVEESQSRLMEDMPVISSLFGRLENGVQVIAVDRQGLCSSLGLFVHTGSRYSREMACLPHMLELMAFRSSAHLSHLRTQKTLEQLGAAASCRVGREDVLFQMDVLREYVPVALPLMLANVLCPSVVCPVQWPLPLCSKLTRPLERVEEPSLCLLTWRLCLKLPTVSPSCDFPTRFPDHGAHCL